MKKTLLLLGLTCVFLATGISVQAQNPFDEDQNPLTEAQIADYTDAFKDIFLLEVTDNDIAVSSMIGVDLEGLTLSSKYFAVLNWDAQIFVPHSYSADIASTRQFISSIERDGVSDQGYEELFDDDNRTYYDFDIPDTGRGEVVLYISTAKPVSTSQIEFDLAANTDLPSTIEIKAVTNGSEKFLVTEKAMTSKKVSFPRTTSSEWTITLTHKQPLRINEIYIGSTIERIESPGVIKFLAKPDTRYAIYFNGENVPPIPTGEAPNLSASPKVILEPSTTPERNPSYKESDRDEDGIIDTRDNCSSIANPLQTDQNRNGKGDECDDHDNDGIINSNDNCPDEPNRRQLDSDNDGIGDVCDTTENRLTERVGWIPWFGIGFAILIIGFLFYQVARTKEEDHEEPPTLEEDNLLKN